MKLGVSVNVSIEVEDKTQIIHSLFNELEMNFSKKNYGKGLLQIIIEIVCLSPEFEEFFPLRKPKYIELKEYVTEGINIKEEKLFTYSLKIDFILFKNQTIQANKHLLALEILKSLSNLDALPKKVKDFDKERFKADMEAFLKNRIYSKLIR